MGQRVRSDYPGALHHVINRGMARRPLFEGRAEARYFLAQLARQVRFGRLEIIAYSLMTSHFHLFVRCSVGELSEALRQATNATADGSTVAIGGTGPCSGGVSVLA